LIQLITLCCSFYYIFLLPENFKSPFLAIMKYQSSVVFAALMGLASATPMRQGHGSNHRHLKAREVPQEHSHDIFLDIVRTFLNLDNPKGIVDPVFGLLGNAAAAQGAGQVTNLDCLKQETADQAFTNAKAAGDVRGMAGALCYQAIERNTQKVGQASVICTETPVNAEIAALTQHQDPASTNAGAVNKAITLELAKQLALMGVDPLLALETGTFAPGNLNDATGKGNACDDLNSGAGCIFTKKLLVLDATVEEIQAAVANIVPTFTGTGVISATDIDFNGLSVAQATGTVANANPPAAATTTKKGAAATATKGATKGAAASECIATPTQAAATSSCTVITTTVIGSAAASISAALPSATIVTQPANGANVQAFTGTLGGPPPPVISSTGNRPFSVNGNTFTGIGAAIGRSCDIQHNACANAANSGQLSGGVGQCDTQNSACRAANSLRKRATDFGTCSDPTIVFKSGLDGRSGNAFIANNQGDFNHGSALNIGVIAGFICQRLGSPCSAPADVQAACTSASAAAAATNQNQAAADAFNSIIGAGGADVQVTTAAPAAKATACPAAIVMTITSCI
jgi:hypothetical protein